MALTRKDREEVFAIMEQGLRTFLTTNPAFNPPTPEASAAFRGDPVELMAIELLRRARDPGADALRAFSNRPYQPTGVADRVIGGVLDTAIVPKKRKKAMSKFNKAVKSGVTAVKKSKFMGVKGKLTNPRTTFAKVTKVASQINRGRKVAKKGVTGAIAKAVTGILGKTRGRIRR